MSTCGVVAQVAVLLAWKAQEMRRKKVWGVRGCSGWVWCAHATAWHCTLHVVRMSACTAKPLSFDCPFASFEDKIG
jgi:hypothetical protein